MLNEQESPLRFITQEQRRESALPASPGSPRSRIWSPRGGCRQTLELAQLCLPGQSPQRWLCQDAMQTPCRRQGSWGLTRAGPAANHGRTCCEHWDLLLQPKGQTSRRRRLGRRHLLPSDEPVSEAGRAPAPRVHQFGQRDLAIRPNPPIIRSLHKSVPGNGHCLGTGGARANKPSVVPRVTPGRGTTQM